MKKTPIMDIDNNNQMEIIAKMPTFCELVAGPEQFDIEILSREFDVTLQSVQKKLYGYGAVVEAHKNYFLHTIQQCAEYNRRNQELLNHIPITPEILTNYQSNSTEANRIWLDINHECSNVLAPIENAIKLLDDAQKILIDKRLTKWKGDQILVGYGVINTKSSNLYDKNPHLEIELNEIQKKFENLFEWIWFTQEMLKRIRNCYTQWNYTHMAEVNASSAIEIIQRKVIWSSFIVEEQPQQVIHMDAG